MRKRRTPETLSSARKQHNTVMFIINNTVFDVVGEKLLFVKVRCGCLMIV